MKVSEVVRELLDSRPYLSDALSDGLINHSALARLLLPDVQKKARRTSPGAVHAAIRRYAAALPLLSTSQQVSSLLANSTLSLKGSLVDVSLKRTPLSYSAAKEAAQEVKWEEGEAVFIVQGPAEIAVVLDRHHSEKLISRVGEYSIRKVTGDLSAVSLKSPDWSSDVPGFYAVILSSVARAKITIRRLISTYPDLVLIVDSKDAVACYDILSALMRKSAGRGVGP